MRKRRYEWKAGEKSMRHDTDYITKEHQRKQRWRYFVIVLACIAVFFTAYSVTKPAVTLEQTAFCGKEEHVHTEECYEQRLICQTHEHTTDCYEQEQVLICDLEESEGHVHDETCVSEQKVLICTEDHEHTDDCYETVQEYTCGMEEGEGAHTHGPECYETQDVLVCEYESEEHVHTEECYERVLICDKEEHEHSLACYSDPEADIENESAWQNSVARASLTGVWAEDLVAVAETQLGYEESTQNYIVTDDGEIKGITRYGQWYGEPYEDWDAMFVSFCMNYAGITDEYVPYASDCNTWMEDLKKDEYDFFRSFDEYVPATGDIVFFMPEGEEDVHTGIIAEIKEDEEGIPSLLRIIMGDSNNRVEVINTDYSNEKIIGYAQMNEDCEPVISEEDDQEAALYSDTDNVFTYSDETGMSVTLTLSNSSYTTDGYELKVEKQNRDDYPNTVQALKKRGEEIREDYIYKIYLFDLNNNQNITALNCPYTLQISWDGGMYQVVTAEDYLRFQYCQNHDNPSDFSKPEVEYDSTGNVLSFKASEYWFPSSAEFIFVRTYAPEGLTAGDFKLTRNSVKDAFITDPAYANYYNSNSPIGTAGSFHIVAFDTATIGTHTNGNVLANKLIAGANFGTNRYENELSYIQNYDTINPVSASDANHVLVIGSGHTVTFTDNNNKFAINGTQINQPNNIVQDTNTKTAPFIDLDRVEKEINSISSVLENLEDKDNIEYQSSDQIGRADLTKLILKSPSSVGVVNYSATDLKEKLGGYVQIDGFKSGYSGTVIINVDCTGVDTIDMPKALVVLDDVEQGLGEVTEFSAGKVIWNFLNSKDVTITAHEMTGIIVAPEANVDIRANVNGTVVAKNVYVNAESHRTDFTGKIVDTDEDVEDGEYYITVQKTETGLVTNALPDAKFNLCKWDNITNEWTKVNDEALVTNAKGIVVLRKLDPDTAYKLEETKAPAGYKLKEGAFYFWVRTDKKLPEPTNKPEKFSGEAVDVGGTLLAANDKETVSFTLNKIWLNSDNTEISDDDLNVESITVYIYRSTDGGKTSEFVRKETVKKSDNWILTVTDLPKTGQDSKGNTVDYKYTVEEVVPDGYEASYSSEGSTFTITNTKENDSGGYELPETGGSGTLPFTAGGIGLIIVSLTMLYWRRHHAL